MPLIVTLVKAPPLVGEKLVMVGAGTTKLLLLVLKPPGVVMPIVPVVVPAATVATISVSETTTKLCAGTPLKVTELVFANPVPRIVALVLGRPVVGEKLVTFGGAWDVPVKFGPKAVPPGVETPQFPEFPAPNGTGTVASICVFDSTENVVDRPFRNTSKALARFVPVMTTLESAEPLLGVTVVIVGAGVAVPVKLLALAASPGGDCTTTGPVPTFAGAVAKISVAEITLKPVAGVPLKSTPVTLLKFVPRIRTTVKPGPVAGLKLLIVGGATGLTVKLNDVVKIPSLVTTVTGPVTAPAGTANTVICVGEFTVKLNVGTPPNSTRCTLTKSLPLMTTWVTPAVPLVGVKFDMIGPGRVVTVKFVLLVPLPPGPTTVIGPVVAPVGTEKIVICVSELIEKLVACTPVAKKICETPKKPVPVRTTWVPTGPVVGEKLVIDGAAGVLTMKSPVVVAVPPGATTVIGPVVAFAGTLKTVMVVLPAEKLVAGTPLNRTALVPEKLVPVMVT